MYSYIKSVFPSLLPHPSNFNFISDISNLSKTCWCNTWMIPNGIQVYGRRESRLKSSLEIHFQVCVAFWTLNIGWNISIVSKYIHWKLNLVWNINFKFAELQIFILLFCTRGGGRKGIWNVWICNKKNCNFTMRTLSQKVGYLVTWDTRQLTI